ncbi:MAG: ACT domain-containing protein, partial [Deltaproteobacteria bacterium]|nr:ACT domain-containing protein [Deltaproteobacteria bacterium]
ALERGLRLTTSVASDVQDFADLVSVEVEGPGGGHVLEGTLFGRREPRLVRFDAYRLDAVPAGNLLLIYNDDVPGVIGNLGSCLGRHGVNISGLNNGRDEPGGRAITLVNIDGAAPAAALRDLAALPHILSVREVGL